MADDLGYGDIGCFGGSHIHTPHIDRLAETGVRLTDFHSNGAVCTPTRAAMFTGRYQQRADMENVVGVNEREKGLDADANHSLVHYLRDVGYTTGLFGKWHLGFDPAFNPTAHGFDEFKGFLSGNIDYHSHVDNAGNADWWHNAEPYKEEGYSTDLINRHTVDFIRENRDKPFFVMASHEAPHWPYQGRNDPPYRKVGSRDHFYLGSRTDCKAAYKEMIEVMDEGVGVILETLEALDLKRKTLVIFVSDNGSRLPERDTFFRYSRTHRSETFDQSSARRGPWKWVRVNQEDELFHLENDLSESHNLADQYPERVEDLRRSFEAWEKSVDQDAERVRRNAANGE